MIRTQGVSLKGETKITKIITTAFLFLQGLIHETRAERVSVEIAYQSTECNRICYAIEIPDKIPDTSCSEYPSDLEETGRSVDVQNIPLRGLWPDGES